MFFNLAQTSGLEDSFYEREDIPVLPNSEKDESAERLINNTDASIIHWPSNEAFTIRSMM